MRDIAQYSSIETVGRPLLHRAGIRIGEDSGAAVLADVLGVVADQPVALARHTVLDLAGRRELEALLHAALGLQLGHFRLLVRGHVQPALAALLARPADESRVSEARAPRRMSSEWQGCAPRRGSPGATRTVERRAGGESRGKQTWLTKTRARPAAWPPT